MRHQLPVHSPVPLAAVGAALAGLVGLRRGAREELGSLLRLSYAADQAILCGSGTEALSLAIEAARRMTDSSATVALPAFTCFDVATAAIASHARVLLYDVDPTTLSPDLGSLERAIVDGARIIIVSPLYGIPVDWAALDRLASPHDAILIEDAAQGHGASYHGLPLGGLGEISTLSFGRGKGWTGGGGGAILLRRRAAGVADEIVIAARRALTPALGLGIQWALARPTLYGIPHSLPGLGLGETVYHEPRSPSALSDAVAAAVLASRVAAMLEANARRSHALWIRSQLADQPGLREISSAADESEAGYLRFPLLANRGVAGFGGNAHALGIAASYPLPLSRLGPLSASVVREGRFPGAERLAVELVTLPAHSLLATADRSRLSDRIRSYK